MRLYNEAILAQPNKVKYYLGRVESVDKNYVITFSIPKILENLSAYPTAYPKDTNHTREIKVGDSVLVEQLDTSTQFFSYTRIKQNSSTGLYFGDVRVDISDGKTVRIETPKVKLELDSQKNTIFLGNDEYSLGQFVKDLDSALMQLYVQGTQIQQYGTTWYTENVASFMSKMKTLCSTDNPQSLSNDNT